MRVVYSATHKLHHPKTDVQGGVSFPHVEQPARAERILDALTHDESFCIEAPTAHGLAPIETVHSSGLIAFLAEVAPDGEGIPDTLLHPAMREGMQARPAEPRDLTGRLGYWCFDTGTPVMRGTFEAARDAVDVALTTADLVLEGEVASYGLCRPPGHHAAHAVFGGFCYFNNAAIAADYLARRTSERVAILDIDYHHGNGSQQIFYERADVLFVSLHGDPLRAYPYFIGHADETGSGAGLSSTLNIPLLAGTNDAQYLLALDQALEALVAFAPAITIVSLGIDTYHQDPLGDFTLTTPVYHAIGSQIASAVKRLVILQEGGYFLPDLGENVRQFLHGAL